MMHILRGREVAGYASGRLGEAWPASSVSLAEGAHRPGAILAPVVGDVSVNMARVPRRTGDGSPVRRTVAMHALGFGGGRLYCGHAPSHHHYVGAALVGAVLAGFRESVFLWPDSGSRSTYGRLLGVGHLMVIFGKVFKVGSPSGSRPVR